MSDRELLPYDVQVGSTIFRKGVPLKLLVEKAQRDNAQLMDMYNKYEPLTKVDLESLLTTERS